MEFFARAFINELTAHDRIRILKQFGDGSSNILHNSAALVYEDFVANLLVNKAPLMRRSTQQSADGVNLETDFAPKLKSEIETQTLPHFQDMKMLTLYKSSVKNFPFVDFYYKEKIEKRKPEDALITLTRNVGTEVMNVSVLNVKLVGITTCFQKSYEAKKCKFDTFDALKDKLCLPDQLLVDYLFCPHPSSSVVYDANATWPTMKEIPTSIFLS